MSLSTFGKLPSVFSYDDITYVEDYIKEWGSTKQGNQHRRHITDHHEGWHTINEFVTNKFAGLLDDDYRFCFALSNLFPTHDYEVHTDMCLRYSCMPPNTVIDPIEYEQRHWTIMIFKDIIRDYGEHKPCTYVFEQRSDQFDVESFAPWHPLDPNLPDYEVDEITAHELDHLPLPLLRKFKVLARLDQEPLTINYFDARHFHVTDAFGNRGIRYKQFIMFMVRKIR